MEKRFSEKEGHLPSRVKVSDRLQLFRERLSEKAHVTIPKGNLWVVLSSRFFKEICNNGTRDYGLTFAFAKGKQQK